MTKTARRFSRIYQIGCIACMSRGLYLEPCQVHHLNTDGKAGQKRRGDDETIGLCPWHHVGDPGKMTERTARLIKGPSYAKQSRKFRETFGSDDELLETQNRYIDQAEKLGIKGIEAKYQ
jgi:hypothetical protein